MACDLNDENVVTKMAQNIERALEPVSIKHVGDDYGQSAPAGCGAIGFEGGSCIRLAAWNDIAQESENLEDPALATLRRHFVFDSIGKGNDIDAIEIGKADIAEGSADPSRVIQFSR